MKNVYLASVLSMLALGKACAMETEKQIFTHHAPPMGSEKEMFKYHLAQLENAYGQNLPVTKEMVENVSGSKAGATDWSELALVVPKYHNAIVERAQAILDKSGEASAADIRNALAGLRLLKFVSPHAQEIYGEREASLERALTKKPFYFP